MTGNESFRFGVKIIDELFFIWWDGIEHVIRNSAVGGELLDEIGDFFESLFVGRACFAGPRKDAG